MVIRLILNHDNVMKSLPWQLSYGTIEKRRKTMVGTKIFQW